MSISLKENLPYVLKWIEAINRGEKPDYDRLGALRVYSLIFAEEFDELLNERGKRILDGEDE